MQISSENIALQLATLRGTLFSTLLGTEETTADFAAVLGQQTAALSANGRNLNLNDPEAAFDMMSQINRYEVDFKAQHAELTAMSDAVGQLEEAGRDLASIDATTANAGIIAQLQNFVAQYNRWEDRFDDTVAEGGVLDNVQAAEVSLRELEISIADIFNGAADGVRGLGALGIDIDPASKQATFDPSRLEAVLAGNKSGAVNAIDAFSANFARSAELLNSDGNFLPNALDNRDRAIDFIADNRSRLEAEFGTGDPARPTGATAQALAAYGTAAAIS